ncbi:MAG TPA: hypothetical protein VNG13_01370 [Mycobacteriales bacterium]|nr:hypothetical protein [Mycobacteriales bacterium]
MDKLDAETGDGRWDPAHPGRRSWVALGTTVLLVLAVGVASAALRAGGGAGAGAASQQGATDALQSAIARTLSTSFHISGTLDEQAGQPGTPLSGDADLARDQARVSQGDGAVGTTLRLVGDVEYESISQMDPALRFLPSGASWIWFRIPPGPDFLRSGALALLDLVPVQRTTAVQRRGDTFTVTVPSHGFAGEQAPAGSPLPPNTDVYTVGPDGLVHAVVSVRHVLFPGMTPSPASTITNVVQLSDFGELVRVAAPPNAQTVTSQTFSHAVARAYSTPQSTCRTAPATSPSPSADGTRAAACWRAGLVAGGAPSPGG